MFFGSGISKPSGMPMCDKITSELFTRQWHRHTDGLFYPGPGGLKPDGLDIAASVQAFLGVLRKSASAYLASRKAGSDNYEHLFSLAQIIEDELAGESHNPALGDFVERIGRETETLAKSFSAASWSVTRNDQLASLARECQVFIESVVRTQLGADTKPVGYRAFASLLHEVGRFEHIDVVTLNHDLLLDRVMDLESVPYVDGFSTRDGEIRFFDDHAISAHERIHLIKPHGAINWHSFRQRPNDSSSDRHGIPDSGVSAWYAKNGSGNRFDNLNGNPVFLTGINKAVRYSTGIFGKQVSWFRHSLEQTKRVVCSGYGWRDDGMNDLLFELLYAARDHRLVVLHDGKQIDHDLLTPPSPWSFRYHDLKASGQLKVIPKWLCCCKDTSEIVAALD